MTRARNLAGFSSAVSPPSGLSAGIVTATVFYGDGSNLSGIIEGTTLSAASGSQRLVVTSLTSGTMTSAATDGDLAWNSSTNTLSATNVSATDVSATTGTFSGNVSVGGTLTYEDVTNVDSVGLITARSGIVVVGGGLTVTGVSTFSNGADFNDLLKESIKINSGKLSDNLNINLDDGMAHYFLTAETSTSTPNIMSGTGINTALSVGETLSVTIGITTGSYAPKVAIDGTTVGVSTYWNGGSAPDAANESGKDIYSYQVIKTADATYDVLANVTNFA